MGKKDDNFIHIQGCPGWMLTMGDCMSLLVTFFVMLMAFSTPNTGQLMDAMAGIQGALGIMPEGNVLDATQRSGRSNAPAQGEEEKKDTGGLKEGGHSASLIKEDELAVVNLRTAQVANRFTRFKERLMEIGFTKLISGEQLAQGIVLTIPTEMLFSGTSSNLRFQCLPILEAFSGLCRTVGNEIQLVSRFSIDDRTVDPARWSLERDRLSAVIRELETRHSLHESRFTCGYEVIPADQPAVIRLTLRENIGVSQMTIQDMIRSAKGL